MRFSFALLVFYALAMLIRFFNYVKGIPGGLGIEQQPAVSAAPPPQRSPAVAPLTQQSMYLLL